MFDLLNNQVTLYELLILYSVVLMTMLLLWNKYKSRDFIIMTLIIFYPALFSFLGKSFQDAYRILTLALTLWICFKKDVFATFNKSDGLITFYFGLFCLSYISSLLNNNDSWTIILSQFSLYIIAYCLWFIIRKEMNHKLGNAEKISQFVYALILMQIIISIAKLIIFGGRQIESIVGSISHIGGAAGTTLPILGFIVLWFYRRGLFSKKDWIFIAGLMLIGFLAGKRAVWFIIPIVIAAFMIYVPRIKVNNTLIFGLFLGPLAFYLGVRLTPTLNAEKKVWGNFDIGYAFDYAEKYQSGGLTMVSQENKTQGRSGATMLLWDKLLSGTKLDIQDIVGRGLTIMYGTDYEEFNELNFGIEHKGNATGVFQTYVTTGYLGIVATILFFFSMLWKISIRRIRWVIIAIVAWEYFFYTGIIFRTPAFMFLIIYFIHYSNYLKGQYRIKRKQLNAAVEITPL